MKRKHVLLATLCLGVIVLGVLLFVFVFWPLRPIAAKETALLQQTGIVQQQEVFLTAHRGFSAIAPENTIPAIQKAAAAGFAYTEMDIHETKDGHWVVLHDETLQRTTTGWGKLKKKTLQELREYTVDNGANVEQYPDLKIPTLEEALDACQAHGIQPQIEVKEGSEQALSKLIQTLRDRGMLQDAVIISFSEEILQQLYVREPKISYWHLIKKLDDETLEFCREQPQFRVAFKASERSNSAQRIVAFQQAGLDLACWTVNDPLEMKRLFDLGICYFTTDVIAPQDIVSGT